MKIQWEAKDIISGRKYRKPGTGEVWLIGYVGGSTTGRSRVSVSMSDGMVTETHTAVELAKNLTEGGYWPEEFVQAHAPVSAT